MHTPIIKDKYTPPASPRPSYAAVRRVMPRHFKSYLWLTFLFVVFGLMLLSDNGIPVADLLPTIQLPSMRAQEVPVLHEEYATSEPKESIKQQNSLMENTNAAAQATPPSRTSAIHSQPIYGTGRNAFTPDDVVILFKTGATVLWRRVPMHLATTLSNKTMTPNVAMYSDQADTIAGRPIIDVLANVSDSLKQSDDFKLYRTLPSVRPSNQYLESGSMEGDHYLAGGWRLDKYRFLPLFAHAAAQYPGKKWYIYVEDDNYFFWHSLYTWLGANFDPAVPFYLGSPAAKLGEDFAHGGSGFMISGAAMEKTFGSDPGLANKFESYAANHCCGDQVLTHAMASKGVPRYRKYDHTSFVGLQALPTWKMQFGKWNWCSPLFNVHKVHQADISRLHEFEQDFHAKHGHDSDATMSWSYIFNNYIGHSLFNHSSIDTGAGVEIPHKTVYFEEWDNLASEKWHSSNIETDEKLTEAEREQKPWFSAKGCEQACSDWELCLSWKFQDDNCALSSTVSAGNKADEGVKIISGYMGARIGAMVNGPACGRSQYIPR